MNNPHHTIDFETWRRGRDDASFTAAYRWLLADHALQRRLAALAWRLPIEGMGPEDRIQEAFLAVCMSSLKRRDGAIPNAEKLERYLKAGAYRCLHHQWADHHRQRSRRPIIEQLRGDGDEAPSAITAARLMELRGRFAEALLTGDGVTRRAPKQARCVAADALLEGEAALVLCASAWVVEFMERLVARFKLTPDAKQATELLEQTHSTGYLMWRLGLDPKRARDRDRFYQRRHRVAEKLRASPLAEELNALLRRLGRPPGLIPCVPFCVGDD